MRRAATACSRLRRLPQSHRQVAHILTSYLDLESFEAIGSWHHAAGDFVVRDGPGEAGVRLVTAREFRPVFGRPPSDVQGLLNACLVFLLQLSLRTRLDRLDGTGDMAWSGPEAIGATVDGMLAALAQKPFPEGLPLPFAGLFERYLCTVFRGAGRGPVRGCRRPQLRARKCRAGARPGRAAGARPASVGRLRPELTPATYGVFGSPRHKMGNPCKCP